MGDYISWYNSVDKMVLISEFHKKDHEFRYGMNLVDSRAAVLDLGVRTWEYESYGKEKVPYQFIFCSVPDRGLNELAVIWPQVKQILPEATLIITSDYTLWGAPEPYNTQFKLRYAGMPGVKFVGNIPRSQLVEYQQSSEVQLYPCIYDENFCIANAECQVAGCYTITSNKGALDTTNFTGPKIFGNYSPDKYISEVKMYYNLDKNTRLELAAATRSKAFGRFGWKTIARQWESIFG
jgi:glycosyltransferase involved in cell wall biosynthesis